MMTTNIKTLTKAQLVEFFRVYRAAFPDWDVEQDVVLVRSRGPVTQYIAFEALRAGSYRPSCSVEVAGPPDRVQMLFRFLDVKHRDVLPREHDAKWPGVLKAMEEQFLPLVRKPIDVADVKRLAEEEVERDHIDNINYSTGLAVLAAYLGDTRRAIYWCNQVDRQSANRGPTIADWEAHQAQFTRKLHDAIRSGQDQSFLAAVMEGQSDRTG